MTAPSWLAWLAGGVPLAYYLATASAHGGPYEEGTFVAAARELGVGHPPGAPISALLASLFGLVPVGPLSFRVALASALCAAVMLGLFARAVFFTLLGAGLRDLGRAALLALAAGWFAAQTPAIWRQAARPDMFAAQFMLSLIVVEALVRFELSEPAGDTRTLYFAAFVQGLCFANHHVFALLMLAAAAPTLGRVFARRGFIGLMGHVAAPILGFSAYAYLPIRASQHPALNFGSASGITNLWWVLNEDPWWGPAHVPPGSALARLADGVSGGRPAVAWVLGLAALIGFGLLARAPAQRRFGALWTLVVCVPLASVALLIRPRLEADAWGALVPCVLGLVALATTGVGVLLERLLERPAWGIRVSRGVCAGLACFGLASLALGADGERDQSAAPDALDDLTRRTLPARAVLLSYDEATVFRHLGAEAEEHLRPDLTLVPLSFLHFPGAVTDLVEAHPELKAPLRAALLSGSPELASLQSLAAQRPVLLELSDRVPTGLYETLVADGWFHRVLPDGATLGDQRASTQLAGARLSALYARIDAVVGDGPLKDRLTRAHFFRALHAAALGDLATAERSLALGLALEPHAQRLELLQAALPRKGRLAPQDFLRSD